MIDNPSFESSEENGEIWASWDDGAVEVPELDNVILRVLSECPRCGGGLALNYTARGITFDHDDVLAQLETENTALKREFGEYAFNTEVVAPQMLELELEANPWIGARQYKEDWIETFFDAILEGK